jgi:drug/metabolite transporter (DMT)-like permease
VAASTRVIVALVLTSALLHATWNALVRVEADKDTAVVVVVAIAWALTMILVAVELALGHTMFPGPRGLAWAAAAGAGETAYFLVLARALASGPLAPVYTLSRGGAVVIVWPLSVAALGEPVTALGALGSAIVLAGLAAAGLARGLAAGAVGWSLATAACVAAYHLSYKLALDAGAAESGTFALALGMATAVNLLRLGPARRAAARARLAAAPLRLTAIGAVCAASFLILMLGLKGGGAGLVLTLRNTSVLFAIALGFAIGERPGPRAIAGAVLVAAGATMLGIAR